MDTTAAGTEGLTSVERGLAVLAAFSPEHPAMTLSDVAKLVDIDRASARRFLHTLLARGYLRTDGALYRLHPEVALVGNAYLASLHIPQLALPHLEALVGRFEESAHVAVLDGDQSVTVARVPSRRLMAANPTVGSTGEAHATALGRVLLAGRGDDWLAGYLTGLAGRTVVDRLREDISRARRQGWLVADEGVAAAMRSVAAPIRVDGRVVAALAVTTHAARTDEATTVETICPAVVEAADRITREVAGADRGPTPQLT